MSWDAKDAGQQFLHSVTYLNQSCQCQLHVCTTLYSRRPLVGSHMSPYNAMVGCTAPFDVMCHYCMLSQSCWSRLQRTCFSYDATNKSLSAYANCMCVQSLTIGWFSCVTVLLRKAVGGGRQCDHSALQLGFATGPAKCQLHTGS